MDDKFCYVALIILLLAVIIGIAFMYTRKDSCKVEKMDGLDGPWHATIDYPYRDRFSKLKRLKNIPKGILSRDQLIDRYNEYNSLYDDLDDDIETEESEDEYIEGDKSGNIIVPRSFDPNAQFGQCAPCVCPGDGLLGKSIKSKTRSRRKN